MEPLTIVVTLASGIILGAWGHTLTSRRDLDARTHAEKIAREERLRCYEAYLVEKEQVIEASATDDIHRMYFGKDGLLNAGIFRREAVKVRRDFQAASREEFDRLDDAIGRMSPEVLEGDGNRTSREKLADAIRVMLKFTRAA